MIEKIPAENRIDWQTIRGELDPLLESVANNVERTWPSTIGTRDARDIIWGNFRLSYTMFRAARYVGAEVPLDFDRKPEFVLALPPLVRSMTDALANVIFLFDDLESRTNQYIRGGFREDFEHFERDTTEKREDRREHLAYVAERIATIRADLNVPKGDEKKQPRWPILGQMIKDKRLSPDRRERLLFVESYFYKELSSEIHLSGPGLYGRAEFLRKPQHKLGQEDIDYLALVRSVTLTKMIVIMLCMSAEIEVELRFGLAERIIRMWARIGQYIHDADNVYRRWYRDSLQPPVHPRGSSIED